MTWEDYDQVQGWPAEGTAVTPTPARKPWADSCYACGKRCYNDYERCVFCRHFPEAVACRSLRRVAA